MPFKFDKDFKVEKVIWKNQPSKSPLSGRKVGCVVGLDNHGEYRAGMEVRRERGPGERSYTKWEDVACSDFKTAESVSREAVRDRLSHETEIAAERRTEKFKPGALMAKASMDDGWAVEVRAPGRLSAAEKYAIKSLANRPQSKQKRQSL
jgi:hypothetical protein